MRLSAGQLDACHEVLHVLDFVDGRRATCERLRSEGLERDAARLSLDADLGMRRVDRLCARLGVRQLLIREIRAAVRELLAAHDALKVA